MTEDQIRQIAEEYAMQNPPSTTDEILKHRVTRLNAEQVFEPFLRFLNERYCMIEREKVMEAYQSNTDRLKEKVTFAQESYLKGRRMQLKDLFGTSMFNQNEE